MNIRRRELILSGLTPLIASAVPRPGAWRPAAHRSEPGSCHFDPASFGPPAFRNLLNQIDPGHDAFVTEKYVSDIGALLAQWSFRLRKSVRDRAVIAASISPGLVSSALTRPSVSVLCSKGPIRIEKREFAARVTGRDAFLESWATYIGAYTNIATAEFEITGIRVTVPDPLTIETEIRYDISGAENTVRKERVGHWTMLWKALPSGNWQIERWDADGETESLLEGSAFQDVTAQYLSNCTSWRQQLEHGVDHWRTVLDAASGIDVYGNNGLAVGDIDGDGFDDLYVCQPSGLPNRLFRNRGNGTFEDVTESAGVGVLDATASALFADFDNDGNQDLLVVRTSGPLLFMNQGNGTFKLEPGAFRFSKHPEGTFTGAATADYNRDGKLDVYFCVYSYYQGLNQYQFPTPYYDAQNGPPNFLFRNRGDGTFEDVTAESGMNQNNNRYSFACGWCDYDNNGWPDLYVANDFGRKNLYRNNGNGTFTDIAGEFGVEDYGAGMSVSWLDYDNDGLQDLYVADMWSAPGRRVTAQDSCLQDAPPAIRQICRKHASGNSLFRNTGNGRFEDCTGHSGTAMGRWSWAGDAWDIDHDGYSDLYVTNGFISGPNRLDLEGFFWRQLVSRSMSGQATTDYELAWNAINELVRSDYSWSGYQRNVFFLNNRDGTFSDVSGLLGLDFTEDSRAFALSDFDHDGRLEIALKNRNAPQLRILENQMGGLGGVIVFRLRGQMSNRDAVGAAVSIESSSGHQTKFIQAGSGFLSQHTKELVFGIGDATNIAAATIHWPSGLVQTFTNLPANRRIYIEEGSEQFESTPFHPKQNRDREGADFLTFPPADKSPLQTWLIEPLPAPDFKLPDGGGHTYSLVDLRGHPVVLTLCGEEPCAAALEQLERNQQAWTLLQASSVHLLAITSTEERHAMPFPVLVDDGTVLKTYDVLYRYLFDRRRSLSFPVSLLLDEQGRIVKLYQGLTEPMQFLKNARATPRTAEDRLRRALPFPGDFHGGPIRRNYFTYGVAFVQQGLLDQALLSFQSAVLNNPEYASAYYNIGTIYLNKHMLSEAKRNLEKALAIDSKDADAWTNLGTVAGEQEDYDEALRDFLEAVRLKPTHTVALQNLVKLYRWQGRTSEARQVLERAISLEPRNPEFHLGLATLLAGESRLEEARKEFEITVRIRPGDAESLNNLGVVLLQLNQTAEALRTFEQCRRLAPDYDRPYLNLALIYKQMGQEQRARELLNAFLAAHPDNTAVQQSLTELQP